MCSATRENKDLAAHARVVFATAYRHRMALRTSLLAVACRRALPPPPRLRLLSSQPPRGEEAKRQAHVDEALRIVHAYATSRFDESVDISVVLNSDYKRSDERVRGTILLPHGVGKTTRVAVFARNELAEEARAAGADIVGAEELVDEVIKGRLDFERCLATPEMMPVLAKAARVLGPKGLMPNMKRGSATTDIADAVRRAKGGEVEFRAQKTGVVLSSIGRATFPADKLRDNALTWLTAVLGLRPERFRQRPPRSIFLNSTHGPGVRLDHTLW